MKTPKNPMQPFIRDDHGTVRFKANKIVDAVCDAAREGRRLDLNDIACMDFSQEDRCQFAQLIGYSLKGYHELGYVSDRHAKDATKAAQSQLDCEDIHACRDSDCEIHCGVDEK